jgi:hypothetical protein
MTRLCWEISCEKMDFGSGAEPLKDLRHLRKTWFFIGAFYQKSSTVAYRLSLRKRCPCDFVWRKGLSRCNLRYQMRPSLLFSRC